MLKNTNCLPRKSPTSSVPRFIVLWRRERE
jgi:hypothetical protein